VRTSQILTRKQGARLSEEIAKEVQSDGLGCCNIRNQVYDNGSNMSGKYNRVEALTSGKNVHALFVSRIAHTAHLVEVQAPSISGKMEHCKCLHYFQNIHNCGTFQRDVEVHIEAQDDVPKFAQFVKETTVEFYSQ
jgi:hypothetical protein